MILNFIAFSKHNFYLCHSWRCVYLCRFCNIFSTYATWMDRLRIYLQHTKIFTAGWYFSGMFRQVFWYKFP